MIANEYKGAFRVFDFVAKDFPAEKYPGEYLTDSLGEAVAPKAGFLVAHSITFPVILLTL